MARLRLVVLGMMGRCPFAGQSWLYLNWLRAFHRLGHEVWYVEDDIVWPYDPQLDTITDDCSYAVAHVARCLKEIGLGDRWAFRFAPRAGACWGLSERALAELYRSADALLNIVGAVELREDHLAAPFRVYVETDPVTAELRLANGDPRIHAAFAAHHALVTYGENYGAPDCGVPLEGWRFLTTRQPIDLDLWPMAYHAEAAYFTTIGNYRQGGRDVVFRGETYRWSKHHEWLKFLRLPRRTGQGFELAVRVDDEADRELLTTHGWRLVSPLTFSLDVFGAYAEYIRGSRGEFTVAKDQNVRLRSGWFSERDACYLASGKPVVAQDTGFGKVLPLGQGLFAVGTVEAAAAAVATINADYERHARGARQVACEYFDAGRVADRLLGDLGLAH
jgi:hypothetical protein